MDGSAGRVRDSLQFRLLLRLGLLILGGAGIGSALSFGAAYSEAHELQDGLLQQIGAMFDRQHLPAPGVGSPRLSPEADEEAVVLVQVLGTEAPPGRGAPRLPPGLPDGLQNVDLGGEAYRVYVRTLTSGERIAVAQETALRDETARAGALRTLAPILILVPVLLLAVADLVRKAFQPLRRIAEEVDRRRETELHPLAHEPLPSEVRPFVLAINRLLDRTEQAMQAERRFIADAAHELRSPMTALGLQAEALAKADMPAEARTRLVTLRAGIERSRNLLEQMLALARAQSAPPGEARALSVRRVFRDVIQDLLPLAEAKGLDLGVTDDADAQLSVGEADLVAVVKNLVENSIRYTPSGGRIDLSARCQAGSVELVVEDDGPGIPSSERERVLDPFYRVPGADGIGSGLGLSIVRATVERLGGRVTLSDSSRSPSGLRVSVTLPEQGADGDASESWRGAAT